ncbi:MAG: hypothetical protein JST87_14295 [Bacteroidetes bacterium]|nr:hypothetical protein [Bacteroidota bacterium]MBS1935331.1 hypothetical protein [Bacteroidota bacterium]
MDTNDYQTRFSKALLTGLFTGIAATLICLIFAVIFRGITGFYLFGIINFPAIIFGCNLIMSVIGVFYFVFRQFLKNANSFFIATFILLAAFCILKIQHVDRTNIAALNIQFREFMSGIIIILAFSAIMIPLLYSNKKFVNAFI